MGDEGTRRVLSDLDVLSHVIKAGLGTGILSLPAAFEDAGLMFGIIATIFAGYVSIHCHYILVASAHHLYPRLGKTEMTYGEVAKEACLVGPSWFKPVSNVIGGVTSILIFITYFLTSSCYSVIIGTHVNYLLKNIMDNELNIRVLLTILIVPFVLIEYIPDLKVLAPFSKVANILMLLCLSIVFYYLVQDIQPISSRAYIASYTEWPTFMAVILYSIQCIGLMLPLENEMINPDNMLGPCGVIMKGFTIMVILNIIIGFFGYLKYGNEIEGAVTLNLPGNELPARLASSLIVLAVFVSFAIHFYLCIMFVWDHIKDKVKTNAMLIQYIMRTVMTIMCIGLAIAVPTIIPFVGLIGAFCFGILGLILPVTIQMCIFYEEGYGKFNYMIFKNIIVYIIAILAMVFGSMNAINEIADMYMPKKNATVAVKATTKAPA